MQDAQFTIGHPSNMSVAFWYPTDGKTWSNSDHYSASCNWLVLDIQPSSEAAYYRPAPNRSWDAATAFALLLSVVAICISIFLGYRFSRNRSTAQFTPLEQIQFAEERHWLELRLGEAASNTVSSVSPFCLQSWQIAALQFWTGLLWSSIGHIESIHNTELQTADFYCRKQVL